MIDVHARALHVIGAGVEGGTDIVGDQDGCGERCFVRTFCVREFDPEAQQKIANVGARLCLLEPQGARLLSSLQLPGQILRAGSDAGRMIEDRIAGGGVLDAAGEILDLLGESRPFRAIALQVSEQ
jgi:hypothetical protein